MAEVAEKPRVLKPIYALSSKIATGFNGPELPGTQLRNDYDTLLKGHHSCPPTSIAAQRIKIVDETARAALEASEIDRDEFIEGLEATKTTLAGKERLTGLNNTERDELQVIARTVAEIRARLVSVKP